MKRSSASRRLAGLTVALGLCLVSLGPRWAESDDPPKEPTSYVRPIQQEESTRLVLQAAGTYSVGFEYDIPVDKRGIFTLVATKEKKVIKSLTRVINISPREKGKPNRQSIRLTMIDSAKFTEGYNGKIRWVLDFQLGTQENWEPPVWTQHPHRKTSWPAGKSVMDLEPDQDYKLWTIKTYHENVGMTTNDTPGDFEYQILFRMETSEVGPREGSSSIQFEDYETVTKERKAKLEKK